jgi:RNA polymerase sigma factor (sigma-70 family)
MLDAHAPPTGRDLLAHAEFVRRLARRLLRDGDDADDLAQDVWVEAFRRPPRHAGNLRGWLSRVATHLALTRLRSRRRRLRREQAAPTVPTPASTVDHVARLELQRDLVTAVLALEEPYRGTVVRRFFDGLEPDEIARRDHVAVKTVYTRLRRALATLRGRLDRRHGDRRAWSVLLLPFLGGQEAVIPGTAAIAGGGLIVSAKMMIAVAGLLALIVAGVTWLTWPRTPASSARDDRLISADASGRPANAGEANPAAATTDDPAGADARPWDLFVRILGPAGRPAGGRVSFLNDAGEQIANESPNRAGRVHLAVRGPGTLVVLPHDRMAPKRISGLTPPDAGRRFMLVRLEGGLGIDGVVLDGEGHEVVQPDIAAYMVDPPPGLEGFKKRAAGMTRINEWSPKTFRIVGLPPGRYRLAAARPDMGARVSLLPDPGPVVEAGTSGVVIRQVNSCQLTLRFLDAETGGDVASRVQTLRVVEGVEKLVSYATEPRFSICVPIGRTWMFRARASGYAVSKDHVVSVRPGETSRVVDVPLVSDPEYRPVRVTLIVRDDAGRPVPGVTVTVQMPTMPGMFLGRNDLTREGGRIAFELDPGTHVVNIRPPRGQADTGRSLGSARIEIRVENGDANERQVVLERRGTLQLVYPIDYREGIILRTPDGKHVSGTAMKTIPGGGKFIAGLPPGPIVIHTRRPDGRWVGTPAEVRVGVITVVEIEMPPCEPVPEKEMPEGW